MRFPRPLLVALIAIYGALCFHSGQLRREREESLESRVRSVHASASPPFGWHVERLAEDSCVSSNRFTIGNLELITRVSKNCPAGHKPRNNHRVVIHEKSTKFQKVQIVERREGNTTDICLHVDSKDHSCSSDEHIYHEALVHPAMIMHPHPRKILILGGAEMAPAREILKHVLVETIYVVDHDKELLEICSKWLPQSFRGPQDGSGRVVVNVSDAVGFLGHGAPGVKFDVIISDLVDPTGSIDGDLNLNIHWLARNRLAENGVYVTSGGNFIDDEEGGGFHRVLSATASVFRRVFPYSVFVPSFQNLWGFIIATDAKFLLPPSSLAPTKIDELLTVRAGPGSYKFLNGATHLGMFLTAQMRRNRHHEIVHLARENSAIEECRWIERMQTDKNFDGEFSDEIKKEPSSENCEDKERKREEVGGMDRMFGVPPVGRHSIGEFFGCEMGLLSNASFLLEAATTAALAANCTIMGKLHEQFGDPISDPQNAGATVLLLLAESHVSIHTWPEFQYAAVDVFTCGKSAFAHYVVRSLVPLLNAQFAVVRNLARGGVDSGVGGVGWEKTNLKYELGTLEVGQISQVYSFVGNSSWMDPAIFVETIGSSSDETIGNLNSDKNATVRVVAGRDFAAGEVLFSWLAEAHMVKVPLDQEFYPPGLREWHESRIWRDTPHGGMGVIPMDRVLFKNGNPREIASLVRESCDPNSWHSHIGTSLVARRPIPAGEEITLDRGNSLSCATVPLAQKYGHNISPLDKFNAKKSQI